MQESDDENWQLHTTMKIVYSNFEVIAISTHKNTKHERYMVSYII